MHRHLVSNLKLSSLLEIACLLLIVGCSNKNGLLPISGQVRYDGQPVQQGFISFIPADGRGPGAETVIQDGRYRVDVAPGPKKVVIEGLENIGERHVGGPESPLAPVEKQYLPSRYSDRLMTELTCDISSGKAEYDFLLKK